MSSRDEKQMVVNEIREKLKDCKIAIMADYRGLDVASMSSLRRRLREVDAELKVAKNTLTRLAAKEIDLNDLGSILEGPTAIAFCKGDPVKPAKLLIEITREFKQLVIKGGVLEGKVIQDRQVRQLAELPSREVLLGRVVGGMQAPVYGLVNVLSGPLRNLVYVIEEIRRQKSAGETG
ncbi:MAG TPA: 50S ribosomal protein L10 [Desulfotomaculum sp.]|nr:MAG: 50S ribosomal protein L10 [Desulfotomaculum sp. 46_80]KUK85362.1 MAG: 50S ribosomal protein L10 [Desulfofundulus kuznetsovii]HAG10618.1 50S ribosomal protein L10 [Desulfotomaculum sp.]HBY03509.1 50S ribosomal protein L10 [Desulfotomaculum sp.]